MYVYCVLCRVECPKVVLVRHASSFGSCGEEVFVLCVI